MSWLREHMKISSGVTPYAYDVNRDAAQKRRFGDAMSTQLSRPDEGTKGKSTPLVETVVEGELLGESYRAQRDETLAFSRVSDSLDSEFVVDYSKGDFRSTHAIEQYRAHRASGDMPQNTMQGQQIDLYV